jgi:hypothetical protein
MINPKKILMLPASCGSFYASGYFNGELEIVEACAYECGQALPGNSLLENILVLGLIILSIALMFIWAWLVDKVLKKVS